MYLEGTATPRVRILAMKRLLNVASLLLAMLLAGCGIAVLSTTSTDPTVRITWTPGLFLLPPIDRTITDTGTVARLRSDIEGLPTFPAGTISCPIDFGTSYTLVFNDPDQPALRAVVSALGCRGVTLSDGRVLWALTSPSLYSDLGAALGLSPDELMPLPCPPPHGTVCYQQPAPKS
jgi:hypothetical protein